MLNAQIQPWDERRNLICLEEADKAVAFAAEHWVHAAERAIQRHGRFAVALSGGSTPKAIYQILLAKHKTSLDWSKVWVFWGDERAVAPSSPESNYHMAMEHGFSKLPIPPGQIFRMKAEAHIEQAAKDYEDIVQRKLGNELFDLVMLGVGADGHVASLFPNSPALKEEQKLVVATRMPDTGQARMSLTFPCILQSHETMVIAIGAGKEAIVPLVLEAAISSPFPASKIGTAEHKALWILDKAAARMIPQ